jgi:CBS domain-containing protein
MATAREIMTEGVDIIDVRETVQEAASRMATQDIGAIPVCDGEGHLLGMITDRDIAVRVVAAGLDPTSTTVGDVTQSTEVVTIGADDPVEEALRTMKEHKVRRLPVIDGHTVVGIVSQGDVAVHLPENQVGALVEAISAAP